VISPELLGKAIDLSKQVGEIGIFGLLVFLFLGVLVIKKIVQFVNEMFHVNQESPFRGRRFMLKRIREFSLLLVFGVLALVSFLGTSILSTLNGLIKEREIMGKYLHPLVIEQLNSLMLLYFLPVLMSFLFLLVLYKWIPEKRVYLKGAVISALITAVLWELVKRGYTYYLIHFSLFGKIRGPIMAIILFGFWMELSMAIMLFGAKLTFLFDQEKKNETG
jgi:membrane protein